MGIKSRLVSEYGKHHSSKELARFALKLLGLDADEKEDSGWRTTENGKHYHINGEGEVDKGPTAMVGSNVNKPSTWNPGVLQPKHSPEVIKAATGATDYIDFWMSLPEAEKEKLHSKTDIEELFNKVREDHPETAERPKYKPTIGTTVDFTKETKSLNLPESYPEIRIMQKNGKHDTRQAHAEQDGVIEVIPENWPDMSEEAISGIIAHEAGHQLSNHDPKLAQAILSNYGDVFGRYNTERGFFDGVYGQSSPEEAFAQCCSEYFNRPENMQERYPDTFDVFQQLETNNPGMMDYIRRTVEAAIAKINSDKMGNAHRPSGPVF